MADFEPRELDLLEDALEDLEDFDDLESLELAPALTERLADYQDVLALCRQAFPLEEPPDTALADVLAEAREVSRRAVVRDEAGVEVVGWRRVWERWRDTLIPGLALAGTAVAVLWVLDPAGNEEPLLENATAERSNDGTQDGTQDATQDGTQDGTQDAKQADKAERKDDAPSEAAGKSSVDEPTQPPEPATPTTQGLEQATEDVGQAGGGADEPITDKKSRISGGGSKSAKPSAMIEPKPEPAVEPLDKEETWELIEQADNARLIGKCERARSIYQQVIKAASNTQAIARAKAGIGLCLELDNRDAEAESWLDQGRAADPGLQSWIDEQRDEQSRSKSKKSKKSKSAEVDALESL